MNLRKIEQEKLADRLQMFEPKIKFDRIFIFTSAFPNKSGVPFSTRISEEERGT